jgi:hypothetical protein
VPENSAFEPHYRISDLVEKWSIGRETLRKIFAEEPGVIKVCLGKNKKHTTYSIPASVAERVHRRLENGDRLS